MSTAVRYLVGLGDGDVTGPTSCGGHRGFQMHERCDQIQGAEGPGRRHVGTHIPA